MNKFFTYGELLDWVDINKLDWTLLTEHPNAIHILEKNLKEVDWWYLSANPNTIHILEKNLDKVNWFNLSTNPNAIHLLEKNIDRVDWYGLSVNPNATHILKKNLDKVDWYNLSLNPNIFKHVYDYNAIKLHYEPFHKELATLFYHPLRINTEYMISNNDDELDYDKQFDKSVISVLKKQRVL